MRKEKYNLRGKAGRSEEYISEFESKLLDLARISHTRAGGKKLRFRAIIITGNKQGKIGVGVAKGRDVALAVEKATRLSKKHIIEVPIVEDTIPHEVSAKYGPAKILLKPQRKGRGLVAGGTVTVLSGSTSAMGCAPMQSTSLMMPPMPVAAPP